MRIYNLSVVKFHQDCMCVCEEKNCGEGGPRGDEQ